MHREVLSTNDQETETNYSLEFLKCSNPSNWLPIPTRLHFQRADSSKAYALLKRCISKLNTAPPTSKHWQILSIELWNACKPNVPALQFSCITTLLPLPICCHYQLAENSNPPPFLTQGSRQFEHGTTRIRTLTGSEHRPVKCGYSKHTNTKMHPCITTKCKPNCFINVMSK